MIFLPQLSENKLQSYIYITSANGQSHTWFSGGHWNSLSFSLMQSKVGGGLWAEASEQAGQNRGKLCEAEGSAKASASHWRCGPAEAKQSERCWEREPPNTEEQARIKHLLWENIKFALRNLQKKKKSKKKNEDFSIHTLYTISDRSQQLLKCSMWCLTPETSALANL